MKLRLLVTLTLLALVGVFLIQNAASVEIRFLVFELVMPRSLLIILLLAIGVVIGWFTRAMYRLARTDRD